jgi:hypothetical protein
MVRTLLFSFLDTLTSEKEREKVLPSLDDLCPHSTYWHNMAHIIFYVEELIFTFGRKVSLKSKFVTPK